jgi:uncharacterized glyoxalase superfamily protein PhnB
MNRDFHEPAGMSPAVYAARSLSAGAVEVKRPTQKPWGQSVGYVRDPNGFLVEICTPMP